ncbi:MAG: DUF3108 domain-containing protein [Ignavibacteria bacterium]|nr:DUF3108 domain-containing protein [Ignavibacteria bacterium]
MKTTVLVFLFSLIISGESISQRNVLSDGEELSYVVYYGFIKLGEVNMKLHKGTEEKGNTVYYAKSEMKSYSGVPIVSLNTVFESDFIFDGKDLYTKRFFATEYHDDGIITIEYKFYYDSSYVYVRKVNRGNVEKDERINFNTNIRFQDGLSLFYKARISSFTTDNHMIPVFMNESETSVNYFFSESKDEVSIDITDNDVRCTRCTGNVNFEGVFGLSGEFAGWFSDDNARVPLKAQLNVIIGNVTLELDSYKRKGWNP